MPGFFDAIKNFKPPQKSHAVEINGKTVQISLEKKLQVQKKGIENFDLVENKDGYDLIEKTKTAKKQKFKKLIKSDRGYKFIDNDIHWVSGVEKAGYTWQTKPE